MAAATAATTSRPAELYLRVDVANDAPETRALRPQTAPKSMRCIDHRHLQVAWATGDGQTVRVRSRYREDPMIKLPNMLLSMITERSMPKGIAALRKAAVERDRRIAKQQQAAQKRA